MLFRSEDESVEEQVIVKKPKKKVQKIIVEDEPSEDETIVVKRRGRPSKPKQVTAPISQSHNELKNIALQSAIDKQTNQLLYNSLFGL